MLYSSVKIKFSKISFDSKKLLIFRAIQQSNDLSECCFIILHAFGVLRSNLKFK